LVERKKKHRKSEELKHLQAKEVVSAGESVEPISSKAIADSSKKTKAELAFQKAKEERVCLYRVLVMWILENSVLSFLKITFVNTLWTSWIH